MIQVTAGSGTKLATSNYTDGADSKHDEVTVLGEQFLASYMIHTNTNISTATASSHLLQIMAGASLKVRIRRIEVHQSVAVTTATQMQILLFRLTTAGTGGTAWTPLALDPADGAAGATAMTLPTVKGTEAAQPLAVFSAYLIQTISASTPALNPVAVFDFDRPRSKPLIIAAGTTNGIAIKNEGAAAAGSVRINVWIDESPY